MTEPMENLLPCPFCGALPILYNRAYNPSFLCEEYDICCQTDKCYLKFGADWHLSKEEIIEKWNKRISNYD